MCVSAHTHTYSIGFGKEKEEPSCKRVQSGMETHTFYYMGGRSRWIPEFGASSVYTANFIPARTTEEKHVSKTNKQTNRKEGRQNKLTGVKCFSRYTVCSFACLFWVLIFFFFMLHIKVIGESSALSFVSYRLIVFPFPHWLVIIQALTREC